MDEIMSVSVVVPREKVSALYTQCSRWLDEFEEREKKAAEPRGWQIGDVESQIDAGNFKKNSWKSKRYEFFDNCGFSGKRANRNDFWGKYKN